MGLTQKLGTIPLAILTDSSNNVGIGAAANASFKFQVTGTTNLTGALSGTSATFSGTVEAPLFFANAGGSLFLQSASDAISIRQNSTSNNLTIRFNRSGVDLWKIQTVPNGANEDFKIFNSQNSTNSLTIASTGAATFSSSVTAGVITSSVASGTGTLKINNSSVSKAWSFYPTTNGSQTDITLYEEGTGLNIMTFKSGGNVGIGTSSPRALLDIRPANNTGQVLLIGEAGTNRTGFGLDSGSAGMRIFTPYANTQMVDIGGIGSDGTTWTRNHRFGIAGANSSLNETGGDVLIGKSSTSVGVIGSRFAAAGDIFNTVPNNFNTYHLYDSTNSVYRFYVSGGGTINATNTTISAISDVRLKENIVDLEIGLDAIMALRPRQFDWKKESGNDGKNVRGFIAQEFEEIFPDLIDESINKTPEGEPYKQIRQDLFPILVKAMQQQNQLITNLEARMKQLENK